MLCQLDVILRVIAGEEGLAQSCEEERGGWLHPGGTEVNVSVLVLGLLLDYILKELKWEM